MTLEEFESHCNDLIKQEIKNEPKFTISQDIEQEKLVWMNDSRMKLRKSFSKLSSQVDDIDASLLEEIIDKKIKIFVNLYI